VRRIVPYSLAWPSGYCVVVWCFESILVWLLLEFTSFSWFGLDFVITCLSLSLLYHYRARKYSSASEHKCSGY
jgi:hypothetical protein